MRVFYIAHNAAPWGRIIESLACAAGAAAALLSFSACPFWAADAPPAGGGCAQKGVPCKH